MEVTATSLVNTAAAVTTAYPVWQVTARQSCAKTTMAGAGNLSEDTVSDQPSDQPASPCARTRPDTAAYSPASQAGIADTTGCPAQNDWSSLDWRVAT